jgi:hypothetical protein
MYQNLIVDKNYHEMICISVSWLVFYFNVEMMNCLCLLHISYPHVIATILKGSGLAKTVIRLK